MKDYMMALHQRFCKQLGCREVRKELEAIHPDLHQTLDRRGQEQLLKLADLENELLDETSLESFLSGFKLALGIAAELAPSYSFDDDEEQRACEAFQRRRGGVMAKKRANGEGNIRKRKDGRWEGRYTAGYDQDGKRIIKNVLGRTQAEVKAKLSVAIVESQQLDVSRSGEYTVAEWLRLWFELYAKPNIRPSTAGYYRRAMEEYTIPRIGTTKLNKLTSRKIQKFYKDLLENERLRKKQRKKHPGLSGSTVRGVHIMLHSTLDRAVKERLLIRNSADGCVVPKIQHQETKTLQPEDLKAYLDAAEKRGALAMFYLELVSGIRKGELVALLWEDLDVEQQTISVSKQATKDADNNLVVTRPKTENSIRQISIPQEAVELLVKEHAKHPGNPWLFPSSRTGAMYHPDSVATLHQRILKDAGLEHLRFHDLRHTFATLALQNGVDIKTVSAMPGHYDAGFTLRTYTHTTRQKQDEAAQTMGSLMAQVR